MCTYTCSGKAFDSYWGEMLHSSMCIHMCEIDHWPFFAALASHSQARLWLVSTCSSQHTAGERGTGVRLLRIEWICFKGVSTPYFCIIHLTPQRWSISRLQHENGAICWRDTAAATHKHSGIKYCALLQRDKRVGSSLWAIVLCGCI